MAQVLQLTHLVQHYGVADVDIGGGRVQPQFDAQRFSGRFRFAEFFNPLVLWQQFFHAAQGHSQGFPDTITNNIGGIWGLIHKGFCDDCAATHGYTGFLLRAKRIVCGWILVARGARPGLSTLNPTSANGAHILISRLTQVAGSLIAFGTGIVQHHPKQLTWAIAALLLGGTGATFAVANLAPDAADLPVRTVSQEVQPLPLTEQIQELENHIQRLYRSDTSRSTDTAEVLLKRLGVVDPDAAAFLRSNPQVQQNLLGRAGRAITAEASADNTLFKLVARWSPEDDGLFKRLTIEKVASGFVSRVETLPMTATSRLASGTIQSSLFAATDESRIPESVALQMGEIFNGDIDFNRALRKGDRFSVVYESLEGDGEPLRAGRVLSTEFVNAGKAFQAMWFQDPLGGGTSVAGVSHGLTKGGYYNLAGESLHKAFLASPVKFSRVTSGFKLRFHPILHTWRAHLGVDFGAPTGTPVQTVGDGTVEFAGVQNGFGNVVMVKHRGDNMTVYAHLSRINVRKGQHVGQGDVVGAVGQTGWATGPHLHFEFRVGGQQRDPLTMARQSESVPVAAASRPMFLRAAASVREQLTAALQMQSDSFQ